MTHIQEHHRSRRSTHGARGSNSKCDRPVGRIKADGIGDDDPLLLSIPAAAAMLSLGRTTVYSLIASGELEAVSIGRSRRVPRAAVVEFVARRSVTAARHGRC